MKQQIQLLRKIVVKISQTPPPTKKYVSGLQTKRKDIFKRFSTLVQKIFTVVHAILQD